MHTIQSNPQPFSYLAAAPVAHSLNDYRIVQGEYGGSSSNMSMRPVLIGALVIAVFGGAAAGLSKYSDHSTVKSNAPAQVQDRSVSFGPSASTSNEPPSAAPAATATSAPNPVAPPMKQETPAAAAVPEPAGRATVASAKLASPVSRPATKSNSATTKRIASAATPAASELTPAQEAAPAAPPPAPIVEQVVVPPPAPSPEPAPVPVPIVPPLVPLTL